jgi:SSS family solute:Na+ symporter
MQEKISLSAWDAAIIILYIALLVGIGIHYARQRKMRTADDLFLGGRSLRWYEVGLSIFSSNVSPMMLVGYCGIAYRTGMVAANFEWLAWWFLLLLAMVFIPHYLTTRVSTMPEFLLRRYGQRSYTFLSYYSMISTLIVWVGFVLYTGGLVISQILGIPFWVAALSVTLLATSYTAMGGLGAVAKTGALQSVVVTVATVLVSILALRRIGGLDQLIRSTPREFWTIFRPTTDPEYPWHALVLGYPVIGIWYWCTDQTIVQRVLAAKNIEQGQYGSMLVAALKVLIPFIFLMPGIYCLVLFPDLANPDYAYVTMVSRLLPVGLTGVALAALVAALINDVAIGLNAFSTVFTLDVYAKSIHPGASEGQTKRIGRVVMGLSAIIAVGVALLLSQLEKGLFDLSQAVCTYLAPPLSTVFLLGVLWKGATSRAANLILFGGSAVCVTIGMMQMLDYPSKGYWPPFMLLSFYLMAGLVVLMILISLILPEDQSDKTLPTLAETYAMQPAFDRRKMWLGWAGIAVVMGFIYYLFR